MHYSQQELKDILQWKINTWQIPLLYWDKTIQWNKINTCLEIGAGGGGLSLWLAKQGKMIHCSDLKNPTHTAKPLHDKYNYTTNKIRYIELDATQPFQQQYDLILTKSVLGGIGRNKQWNKIQKTIENIYKALAPNGSYLFAENAKASTIHQIVRKKYVSWSKEWHYFTPHEMKKLLSIFPTFELHTFGFISPFCSNTITKKTDICLHNILPTSQEYLLYGWAQKI